MARRVGPLLLALSLLPACGGDGSAPCEDVFEDASCIDVDRILADVETLASPAMAGRRAGFPGNDLAVDFVDARFASLGLPPPEGASSRRHAFPVEVWEAQAPPTLAIGGLELMAGVGDGLDVVDGSASGTVTDAPVVFAGYGMFGVEPSTYSSESCPVAGRSYDDFESLGDLTGKVVVMLEGFPSWVQRCYGPVPPFKCQTGGATDRGAVAVIYAPPAGAASQEFSITACDVPVVRISREVLETAFPSVRDWEASIASGAPSSHETEGLRATVQVQGATEQRDTENVLAIVPGSDPVLRDEVVVIGAHLDSLGRIPFRETYYPGANDNASGLAVVLELARVVAESPTRPRRTLLFAAWNAEEWWMVGSYAYVAAPLVPLDRTVAAFAVDMVGVGPPELTVTDTEAFPEIRTTLEAGRAQLGLPAWRVDAFPWKRFNDHTPFVERGIPGALFITSFGGDAAYHTIDDSPQNLSPEAIEVAAKLVWATVRQYALGEDEPQAPASATGVSGGASADAPAPACFTPGPALGGDRF